MVVRTVVALGMVLACLVPGIGASAAPTDSPLGEAQEAGVSADPENPAMVTAGLWRTELAATPNPRQFRYLRTSQSSTVHLSVVGAGAVGDGFSIATEVGGTECTTGSVTSTSSPALSQLPFGVQVVVGGDFTTECASDSLTVNFAVERVAAPDSPEPLPIVIKVVEEVPLLNGTDLGDTSTLPMSPDSPPLVNPPNAGTPSAVTPGRGYDDAPVLTDGTVSGSITQGEVQYFAVDLDWGQSVNAAVDVAQVEKPEDTFWPGPDLELVLADPMRVPVEPNLAEATESVTLSSDEAVQATTGFGPVGFLDRFASRDSFLPGRHWLMVTVEGAAEDEEPETFDYELSVAVDGEVTGHPRYAVEGAPFLVGDGVRSEFASGNPLPAADSDSWLTGRRLGALLLGLVGLACLALGAVQLRRRRA